MIVKISALLLVTIGLLVAACGDDEESAVTGTPDQTPTASGAPSTATPDPGAATDSAIEALGTWLGPVGDPSAITVEAVEAVTWPDGCLGLQRVSVACTEALIEGFRIDLGLGEAVYEVRTDLGGDVALWRPSLQVLALFKEALTNSVQFTTDDGGVIEAQPVFGTDYGVDLGSIVEGDPVGVALADAPQGGGWLLVWVDPAEPQ